MKKRFQIKPGVLVGTVVELYATIRNTELNEGRGSDMEDGYYLTREDAVKGAKGIDVMGSDGRVKKLLGLKLDNGKHFILREQVRVRRSHRK